MSSGSQTVSLVGRYFNAACYIVSGIVLIAIAAATSHSVLMILVGIGMGLYGGYVGLTRGSYWVSTWTYLIPLFAIVAGIAIASR